jgi:hypothetical protein
MAGMDHFTLHIHSASLLSRRASDATVNSTIRAMTAHPVAGESAVRNVTS